MSAVTRKQVHRAISDALLAHDPSQVTLMGLQDAADAVMALYEAAAGEVLWQGETGPLPGIEGGGTSLVAFAFPPGTRIVVTEATPGGAS